MHCDLSDKTRQLNVWVDNSTQTTQLIYYSIFYYLFNVTFDQYNASHWSQTYFLFYLFSYKLHLYIHSKEKKNQLSATDTEDVNIAHKVSSANKKLHSCSLHNSYIIVSSRFVLVLIYGVGEHRCAHMLDAQVYVSSMQVVPWGTFFHKPWNYKKWSSLFLSVLPWLWTFYS